MRTKSNKKPTLLFSNNLFLALTFKQYQGSFETRRIIPYIENRRTYWLAELPEDCLCVLPPANSANRPVQYIVWFRYLCSASIPWTCSEGNTSNFYQSSEVDSWWGHCSCCRIIAVRKGHTSTIQWGWYFLVSFETTENNWLL